MKNWTLLDDARLLTLVRKGWTRKQIAADFGVTRNAICGRVHRLIYKPDEATMQTQKEAYYHAKIPADLVSDWRVGQRVVVDYARAWSCEAMSFVDWRGEGVIDMIEHRGKYIRVAAEDIDKCAIWINGAHFDDVKPAPVKS